MTKRATLWCIFCHSLTVTCRQELTEIELLIKAVESLKPTENIFKDYVFPVVAPFFTPVVAPVVAPGSAPVFAPVFAPDRDLVPLKLNTR